MFVVADQPLACTLTIFWRMVLERNVTTLVMIGPLIEEVRTVLCLCVCLVMKRFLIHVLFSTELLLNITYRPPYSVPGTFLELSFLACS